MKKKWNKFKREPKQFFLDAKLMKFFNRKITVKNTQKSIKEVASITVKNTQKSIKEPLLYGTSCFNQNTFSLDIFKKTVINQNLGFSSLVITEKDDDYLINKPYLSMFLKDKSFIGFKNKSLYFFRDDPRLKNIVFNKKQINELFLKTELLRQNKFSVFRNIISINMLSPTPILIKNSNPFIRLICIIDNNKSLEYIKNYITNIDVLIVKNQIQDLTNMHFSKEELHDTFNHNLSIFDVKKWIYFIPKIDYKMYVPKIVEFRNDFELLNITKTMLIDNSYKTDCNVLLPIITSFSNLKNIDLYNKHKTQGLIRLKGKLTKKVNDFNSLIDESYIEELYLAENIYCLYKDMIFLIKDINNQMELKTLLKKTLLDGVHYEEI